MLTSAMQTICARNPNEQLTVNLVVPSTGTEINGTARCFRFGIEKGRVTLSGALDPRVSLDKVP
jgi:hypothetical protein